MIRQPLSCRLLPILHPTNFSAVYSLLKLFLFQMDPEKAHYRIMALLVFIGKLPFGGWLLRTCFSIKKNEYKKECLGLTFTNPVGLAAGFDKNGEWVDVLANLGFGFIEVGTITPWPQPGNPLPRLFRLIPQRALINRMGFNNKGVDVMIENLKKVKNKNIIIGGNIGKNKDTSNEDAIHDYVIGFEKLYPYVHYFVVNVSSPNTPGLRALQDKAALDDLLLRVRAAAPDGPPLFLKVAPDLEPADIDDISAVASERGIDALIVSNTTITRPPLKSRHAGEAGGLSGAPLKALAQQRLIDFRKATAGKVPLIGVGGITSAEDAYARIRAGASLVQLYSALVYEGPFLAQRINSGLATLLKRDGFDNIAQAIGVDVD